MTPERWQRVDELFTEARQRAPDARAEFVVRACGNDRDLRADVMSLLSAADESHDFMAAPALHRLASDVGRRGWSLRSGERIGAYTVDRRLGVGGGGEVWRARDERLGRDVAIKVLLPQFSSDVRRLRAFTDEARTAGGLNHPNIVAIYDVGDYHGAPFLVSECLEGESLRQRLAGGPLGPDRAIAIALQLARGLAAVHARGIIHRDLKPENVFLRSDGGVKIIDFGLAKLQANLPDCSDASAVPVVAPIVAGTVGYMSPEQVRGDEVDARTDLFALGATMYEMLAGRRPFASANTQETLRAILATEPPDLADIGRPIPPELAAIVRRLVEKAPADRFQSAADLAWALERLAASPRSRDQRQPASARVAQTSLRRMLAFAAIGLVVAMPLWMRRQAPRTDAGRLAQFTWPLPSELRLSSEPLVSPDSTRIAFVGADSAGSRIFIRHLSTLDATAVTGTEGAKQPFWSPDGTSLGYFASGKLMKVAVDGGAPTVICDAPDGRGGAWSPSGVIVFQPDFRDTGLMRVRDSGGPVEPATLLDVKGSDVAHRWPVILPDGRHFLFLVVSADDERRGVYVASLDVPATWPSKALFPSSSGAVYVPMPGRGSGIVLSAADRWIEARPFHPARLQVTGDVRKIELPAAAATPHHGALLSASLDVLAFGSTSVPWGAHLAGIARTGADLSLWPEREMGGFVRVSPDGGRLARTRVDALTADIWVDDLLRKTHLRVTTSRDLDMLPVWSPDGQQIAYRSGTKVQPTLNVAAADGTGVRSVLPCPRAYCEPTDWTSTGLLIVNVSDGDVWKIPVTTPASARPILSESFLERDARVSPDGRWIAYVSDESGRAEVSVRNLTGLSRRFVVSNGGGDQPVWRRDGAELLYVAAGGLLHGVAVHALENGGLSFGAAQPLAVPRFPPRHLGTVYDLSPDGTRVYFHHPGNARASHEVGIVLGWRALLK